MKRKYAEVESDLARIYELSFAAWGPQGWWPGRTHFEVCVGAILTQNTAWTNVEKAIARLRAARLLTPSAMRRAGHAALEEAVKPSGYYRIKARYLLDFVERIFLRHGGRLERLLGLPGEALREELLEVRGIGPETADSIVLYAAGHPSFVVDAYTRRILQRHFLLEGKEPYEEVRALFQRHLPADATLYNEYHALLVRLAKEHCRKKAHCEGCPLEGLPHRG